MKWKMVCLMLAVFMWGNIACGEVIFADDFDRSNGNLAGTATSVGGYAWTASSVAASSAFTITNGQMEVSQLANSIAGISVDCDLDGISEYTVSFDLTVKSHSAADDAVQFYYYDRFDNGPNDVWYGYRVDYNGSADDRVQGIVGGFWKLNNFQAPDEVMHVSILNQGDASTWSIDSTTIGTIPTESMTSELRSAANDGIADYVNFMTYSTTSVGTAFVIDNLVVYATREPTYLVFSPEGGIFEDPQNVVISCETTDAVIYYTIDGSDPSLTNGTQITSGSSVLVDQNLTLNALAWVDGVAGTIKSTSYAFKTKAPTFAPAGPYISEAMVVTMTCGTPGATIYYTTDGNDPTIASDEYVSPVTVNDGTTLKAMAVADGSSDSDVVTQTYTIPDYNRPACIDAGSATVDGDLADWADATWVSIDQVYYGSPTDIVNAYYAVRWSSDKIYVAIMVEDSNHYFCLEPGSVPVGMWDDQDGAGVSIHTTGLGPVNYALTQADAQQYSFGPSGSDSSVLWSCLGDALAIPSYADYSAACSIHGRWIYYEVAVTPFQHFDLNDGNNVVVSSLSAGDVIGLDVGAGTWDASHAGGLISENLLGGAPSYIKWCDYEKFGLHKLVPAWTTVDQITDGEVRGTAVPGFGYIEQDLGAAFSSAYPRIKMSGQISNAMLLTNSDWTGSWLSVGLVGMDYFQGTVSATNPGGWTYFGDTAYGEPQQQAGFGSNAGLQAYDYVLGDSTFDGFAFVAEDCNPPLYGENRKDFTNQLGGADAFDFELEYDLDAMTMVARIKAAGAIAWLESQEITIGDRSGTTTNPDDWSSIAPAIQLAISPTVTTECGVNYNNVVTKIQNVLPGDASLDGAVDVGDLGILAANYGTTSGATWQQGDFTGDGSVDVGDLGILAANYGSGTSGANWDADYAKVFGEAESDDVDDESTLCSTLGFPLIAGLALMGLMLVKLDE